MQAVYLLRWALTRIILAYTMFPLLIYLLPIPFISSIQSTHPHIHNTIRFALMLCPPTIFSVVLLFSVQRQSTEDFDDRVANAERERGLAAGENADEDGQANKEGRVRESAEWLNAVLRGVWPIVNPDL